MSDDMRNVFYYGELPSCRHRVEAFALTCLGWERRGFCMGFRAGLLWRVATLRLASRCFPAAFQHLSGRP
jgi:hypothetical protein